MRAIAINVGANTNEPGFRGPVYPDGSFEFIPIPESEPVADAPTYGDLAPHLDVGIPESLHGTPVHLDPEFPAYPCCERYTYGDPWGVKAGPLLELSAGDSVLFYATLAPRAGGKVGLAGHPDWVIPEWGAYLIGEFRLARDPVPGEAYAEQRLPTAVTEAVSNNAHVRRAEFDAAVLLLGDGASGLYDRPVALSGATGTEAGPVVSDLSADSGRGPWWRRPLRFDAAATRRLRDRLP